MSQSAYYEDVKSRAADRSRAESSKARDIGDIPAVVNPERKARCEKSLRSFCLEYFPERFPLEFAPHHEKIIAAIEATVLNGGQQAVAAPRGDGKTTLCECGIMWAEFYGFHSFALLIAASDPLASSIMDSIKTECESNDLLADDFPEIVYPIRKLEGIPHRCNGQTCNGVRTQIGWTADELVFPLIDGSKAAGSVIRVAGLTGSFRGLRANVRGKVVRPSIVLIDDPQTDASARSAQQCLNREATINGSVMGLAGPGKRIAALAAVTVIRPNDLADNLLNRDKHPEWNGIRCKALLAPPTNETLWTEYAKIRKASMQSGDKQYTAATEFYAANREAMDAGSVVAWPQRFEPQDLSALQTLMNIKIDRPSSFAAEQQNEPLVEADGVAEELTVEDIIERVNHHERRRVPLKASRITAFIDVQKNALYYVVCAWADDFTGWAVDYGTFPDQKRKHFHYGDIPAERTLSAVTGSKSLEGSLRAGLVALTAQLCGVAWVRDDGTEMRMDRCGIDANWGDSTDLVKTFARETAWPGVVIPCHGRFVGASGNPMYTWKEGPGERKGLNWIERADKGRRYMNFDTNFWKSFFYGRLTTPLGEPSAFSLFGDRPEDHRMLAEQFTAEQRVLVEARGRKVHEWKNFQRRDNHFFDCAVGCTMLASFLGSAMTEHREKPTIKKRVNYAEQLAAARRRAG